MKMPFLLISPKIVPKIQLIKKGGCYEYYAVIADKIEYRYIHEDFELIKVGRYKRATKESFEKWYHNQTRYQLAEDRQERS